MVKKAFILAFLAVMLFAKEKHYVSEDPMKALFMELAAKSFFAEFEYDRNLTNENKKDIKKIKADIEQIKKNILFIVQELNKRNNPENTAIITPQAPQKQTPTIKDVLNSTPLPKQPTKAKKRAVVVSDGVAVRLKPEPDSVIIKRFDRGEMVNVYGCDKFDWCKIDEGYIAKYLITIF